MARFAPACALGAIVAIVALAVSGCGTPSGPSAAQERPAEVAGERPVMPSDHPDRHACEADADCMGGFPGAHPTSDDPCCTGYPGEHVTRAYAAWSERWRAEHCSAPRDCPALPPPAPPAECFFEARCVEGRCTHACGD